MKPIHPKLLEMAEEWPVTQSTYGNGIPCDRCEECDGAIAPASTTQDRLAHLLQCHGWRMDGRRFSNKNEILEVL